MAWGERSIQLANERERKKKEVVFFFVGDCTPSRNDGLYARPQFNNANLCILIEISGLDIEEMRPSSETICFAFGVECV